MQNQKPLEFHGTAGGYFILFIITLVLMYIPFFGWAFLLNYTSEWLADNSLVNGKKVKYHAGYGESLKFVFINSLLLLITLGIYTFWFYPKLYRYVVDHVGYGVESPESPAPVSPEPPVAPTVFSPPTSPTAPPPAVPTPPAGPVTG